MMSVVSVQCSLTVDITADTWHNISLRHVQ